MLNEYFYEEIEGKTGIAPSHCPMCQAVLFVEKSLKSPTVRTRCQACSVSYDLLRSGDTIRYLPRKGRIETLSAFQHLLKHNAIKLPGCPKCDTDRLHHNLHEQTQEMQCCDVLWIPVVKDDQIVYEPNSPQTTPQFEKQIRSMSVEDYAHRLAMFAAEYVCYSSDRDAPQSVAPAHTDIAGQILTYLTQHQNTAKTAELIAHIGCSTEGFNKAAKKLITAGDIQRKSRGVYRLT